MVYELKKLINKLLCIFLGNNKSFIITESYVVKKNGRLVPHNWGDDINILLFEHITKKHVLSIPITRDDIKITGNYYSLIGSILSFYNLDNKIVYGSGLINPDDKICGTPKRIISVRGPKTRSALVSKGYECPEKYGDPALLLPVFYQPQRFKSNQGCLIVNMGTSDIDNVVIHKLREKLDIKIVSMTTYNLWTDVIDEIVNSSFVISESLHGLIVAETYGIPNVWVELQNHPKYWDFKFNDYYESIGKLEQIIKLQENIDIDLINRKKNEWVKANINYNQLLSYFPFEIKCNVFSSVVEEKTNGE